MNVNGVVLLFPSALFALSGAMENEASSLMIVPIAVGVSRLLAPTGFDSVMRNVSVGSIVVSPVTLMVMTCEVSPAVKLSVPLGSVPPKSPAFAGLTPLPVTAKSTLVTPFVKPVRVTVKVCAV